MFCGFVSRVLLAMVYSLSLEAVGTGARCVRVCTAGVGRHACPLEYGLSLPGQTRQPAWTVTCRHAHLDERAGVFSDQAWVLLRPPGFLPHRPFSRSG